MTSPARARATAPPMLLACIVLPIASTGYQLAATMLARGNGQASSLGSWCFGLMSSPWALLLLACEATSFGLWMIVLGRWDLAKAFPLTALGYVLAIALSTIGFGEPLTPLRLVGSAAILAGAWLLAS